MKLIKFFTIKSVYHQNHVDFMVLCSIFGYKSYINCMQHLWKILLCLLPISISAQNYAPDTTFRFSASTFKLPAYKFIEVTASNKKYTLARIKPIDYELSYQTNVLLDAEGQIITTISDGLIVPNSLTENGFWVSPTSYANEIDSVFNLYYYDISLRTKVPHQLKLKYPTHSIVSIENGCAIFQNFDKLTGMQLYNVYDLEKDFIAEINPSKISKKPFTTEKFYIQELRVDTEKNTWVLVNKNITNTAATLQLYKTKPNESLSNSNLIFEKTDKDLGNEGGFIWRDFHFFENQIIFIGISDSFKPRELIKFDLQGNTLSKKVILPLLNNDPNTSYGFIKSTNTNYICFRVNESIFYFLDKQGISTSYKMPTEKLYNVNIDNDKLIYVDDASVIHVVDIPTLQELPNYKSIPNIDFQPIIPNIQTLDNNDFWLGYQNPYQSSKFFVKYHQNKEVFRFEGGGIKIQHLSKNSVLIQDIDGKIRKVDSNNEVSLLPIKDNNIVYVDTLHSHIYTNTNGSELNRYFYDGTQDLSFKWVGGEVRTEITVDDNGKIYSLGKRYLSDGSLDPSFKDAEIQLFNASPYSAIVFILKKIGTNILMINGACSMGCFGKIYFWSQNDNAVKQISGNGNISDYMGYRQFVRRDSLFLAGYTKISQNLETDSNFKLKGLTSYTYPYSTLQTQTIDILPNHDLLIATGKSLNRFSPKNNLWVEIRNLKSEIILTDSLLKSGLDLDVFSSDNSEVKLQLENIYNTKAAYIKEKKIGFTGKEGTIKIIAKSVKGGNPYEVIVSVRNNLRRSNIKITPTENNLYVGFSPFPISITVDNNLPLTITTEGDGAYIKDGMIYPTGKSGFLRIKASHEETNGYYANSQTLTFFIHKLPQTLTFLDIDKLTNTYYLPESAFPFKIPVQIVSKLPIRYSLNSTYFSIHSQIFYVSNDTVYLNPDYKKIIQSMNTDYSPIGFVVNGYQAGNNIFQDVYFTVNFQLLLPQEEPLLAPLDVFPNPFDNFINIYCPNNEDITETAIYDVSGKLIKEYKVTSYDYWTFQFPFYSPKMKVVKLFTDNILHGNYILVFTANNQKITKRIIR